jgi:predicted DNA-binding transcriptional regulator AlpA
MSRVSRQAPKTELPPDCMRIEEFCERNRISRQFYYLLRERGQGPTEIRLGGRVLISKEAADEWRRQLSDAEGK